jgi:NAD(P)-dependent dehydrogenase (short-subunit alcohol dehydrogenase family)
MLPFENKVALVTGSGRGLGRVCAQTFARQGAKVVVASITRENGEETVGLIRKAGGEAIFVQVDVAKSSDVEHMVQAAIDTYGGLDCAINNAAVLGLGPIPLADIDEDDWNRTVAVNFTGVFLCMKHEIRTMLKRRGGAIVNIGSGNEHTALPGLAWYLAAKQGVYGMTKVAALDYGGQGIRVNAVAPGPMWTPSLREAAAKDQRHVDALSNRVPLGRIAEPEEVAEVAVWLCSPAASYVLGHIMSVDGGFVMGSKNRQSRGTA